jgi:predicted MFS family arabinose efflux permease
MKLEGKPLLAAMCVGQVGNLLPHVVVPAVMAQHLMPLWKLTAGEAGLLAGSFAVGYMLAVPGLTALTDRVDARLVLLVGSLISGVATLAFGRFAHGLISGLLIWGIAGMGFAGAYMPGLKALTDRLGKMELSRSVTLYTACFSLGVALSFLTAQIVANRSGWQAAFYVTALGPLAMVAVCLSMAPVEPIRSSRHILDFRPVFRNRTALGYIFGYGTHCFELYAFRTWIVAFWTFVAARNGGSAVLEPITVSVILAVLAMPASIVGNEAAIRFGRPRAIAAFMYLAGILALLMGILIEVSPALLLSLLLVYAIAIPADSGALTSGMTASADPAFRGATMALHSTVGFGLSAVGGWAAGLAIDLGGGINSSSGWMGAFLVMAAGGMMGPVALWWSERSVKQDRLSAGR